MPHRARMSIKEVCHELKVSRWTVWRWMREDPPAPFTPHTVFGAQWEVSPYELETWLAHRALRRCQIIHDFATCAECSRMQGCNMPQQAHAGAEAA